MSRKAWRSWSRLKSQLADLTISSLKCWKQMSRWLKLKHDYYHSNTRFKTLKRESKEWRIRSSIRLSKLISKLKDIKRRKIMYHRLIDWKRRSMRREILMKRSLTRSLIRTRSSKQWLVRSMERRRFWIRLEISTNRHNRRGTSR